MIRDSLDAQIDDLYRLSLTEFTPARNALAKTVRGADATHVRTLAKPTVVAWAVNQVYWRSSATYERLMRAGEKLRRAQISALTGKNADLRDAGDAHRQALADAVKDAERIAGASGSKPAPDALMRTFEALSLAKEPPSAPGRLVDALQPAGFEALAGVTPSVRLKPDTTNARRVPLQATNAPSVRLKPDPTNARGVRLQATNAPSVRLKPDTTNACSVRLQADQKKKAAEEKKRAAEIKKAEAALARAKAKMRAAEEALKRTQARS